MGEIADMILNGDLCEECGTYISGDAGFPRLCAACAGDHLANGTSRIREDGLGGFQKLPDVDMNGNPIDWGDDIDEIFTMEEFNKACARATVAGLTVWITRDRDHSEQAPSFDHVRQRVGKVSCPICSKMVKKRGLKDHTRDVHGGES